MLMALPDKWLGKLSDALSQVYSASIFASICMTHPAVMQLCVLSSLIGLAQAAAVDRSPRTPAPEHKTCNIVLPVLLLLLVASLVAVWWVRRRATRRAADQGTLAPRTPFMPVSIPSLAYIRLNRSESLSTTFGALQAILNMANALTATPIVNQSPRRQWTNPEIILAGLSVLLTVVGLVLGGLGLIYAQRQASQA
jgi:FtsH-binding integral membrane protein